MLGFYSDVFFFLQAGPLCLSKHEGRDRRLDDDYPTFRKFNRTLVHTCEPGEFYYSCGKKKCGGCCFMLGF